jgi:hypothetical protein
MRLPFLLALTCTFGVANTLTNPSFGQTPTNCNYSQTAPYTTPTCPVIGDPLQFDIQSISVSVVGDSVTATIDFNYGGGQSLAPFTDGNVKLQPGDLFFFDPSDPNQVNLYGVALNSSRPGSHYNFTAGDLYQLGGNITVETAKTALGNPSGAYYRPTEPVLMVDNVGTPVPAGIGNGVSVTTLGNGKTAAEYAVTVQFAASPGLQSLLQSGSVGVSFASADCGNAVLSGVITGFTPTPEPEGAVLMGLGIGLIGVARYWRRKSAR